MIQTDWGDSAQAPSLGQPYEEGFAQGTGTMDLSAYEPIHPQYQLLKASIQRNRELAYEPWPTGDWNDGMDRVGQLGRGESVWMGWFLHMNLAGFWPLAGFSMTFRYHGAWIPLVDDGATHRIRVLLGDGEEDMIVHASERYRP